MLYSLQNLLILEIIRPCSQHIGGGGLVGVDVINHAVNQFHYRSLTRKFHEYKGYLGEVFMAQVLWNGQPKTLPGRVFHSDEDVTIPWLFDFIHHRMRLKSRKGQEIDLIAAESEPDQVS